MGRYSGVCQARGLCDPAAAVQRFCCIRPGFAQMFAYLLNHADVRTILVESPQHFARDLIARETGFRMLKGRGIDLVAVDHPESFTADTPLAMMVRQILGAVHQFQRTMLVSQLRAARERKRALHGKCQVSRAGH